MIYYVGDRRRDFYPATLKDVVSYCSKKKRLGLDIESNSLDPWTGTLLMLQIGDKSNQFVIDCRRFSKKELLVLKPIIENKDIAKYLTNASFDYKWICHHLGIRIRNLKDIMIQNQVIYDGLDIRHSLEAMLDQHLGIVISNYKAKSKRARKNRGFQLDLFDYYPGKDIRKEFAGMKSGPFSKQQIIYGAYDVVYPLHITDKQQVYIDKNNLTNGINIENAYVKVVGETELNGMYIDESKWIDLYEDNKKIRDHLEEELNENYNNNVLGESINWTSSRQVCNYFYNILKLPIKVYDKKDRKYKLSVKEEVLDDIDHPIAKLYNSFSKMCKATSTYGLKFLENINPISGRVHSSYRQMVSTGRPSSSNVNLNNIPARGQGAKFRTCFSSQEKGWSLGVIDFSGQEARIIADQSGDKEMLSLFNHGDGDMHKLTGSAIFNKPKKDVTPDERRKSKTVNFLMNYIGGASTLAKRLKIKKSKASNIIKLYHSKYKSLRPFYDKCFNHTIENGYILIDNITNKKHYHKYLNRWYTLRNYLNKCNLHNTHPLRSIESEYNALTAEIQRKSVNYKIQGTAAMMTKLTCVYFYNWVYENNLFYKIKFIGQIYDEIVLELHNSIAEEAVEKLKSCAKEAGAVFCKKLKMDVDGGTTLTWDH